MTIRIRVFFFEPVCDPTVGVLIRDRLGNEVWGTNTYLSQVKTGDWQPGQTLELRIRAALALGPGEYSLTAAVHTLAIHLYDPYDWLDGVLLFRVFPADEQRSVGVAYLQPEIDVGAAPATAAATAVLTRAFGTLPSSVKMGGNGRELLRSGWYAVEGTGQDAFRWTEKECSFLLSVGSEICIEAGVNRPPGAPSVELSLVSLGRELGRARLEPEPGWRQVVMPLPPDFPKGPARLGLVASDSWRPADTGHGPDPRALGVRIRRIWSPGAD